VCAGIRAQYPDIVEPIFNSIDGISHEAIQLLTRPEGLGTDAHIHRPSIQLNSAQLTVTSHQSSGSDHGSIMGCNDDEHLSLHVCSRARALFG
jgi:hypothetical protein